MNAKNAFAATNPGSRPGSAARSADRCSGTGPSSSRPTNTTTSTTCGSSPCRPATRSPPRTARFPRAAPITCSTPSRPPLQRRALPVRPLRVRRPVHPAQRQHHLRLPPGHDFSTTHSLVGEAPRSCRPGWSTACASTTSPERRHAHPQQRGGDHPAVDRHRPAADLAAVLPAEKKTTLRRALYYTTARHDIKLGGDYSASSTGSYESHANETGQFTFTTDRRST